MSFSRTDVGLCIYQLMVSRWSVSDGKSPQVSRTLLSILVDLNNAVVCMVSTRSLISKSSSPVPIFWLLYPAH